MYISTKRGLAETRANINLRAQYAVSSLANTDYFDQLMTGPELLRYYEETGIYKHDSDDPRERSEEHTSELQSRQYLVCRLLLEKKNTFAETTAVWAYRPG